jgi:hypothetical protein
VRCCCDEIYLSFLIIIIKSLDSERGCEIDVNSSGEAGPSWYIGSCIAADFVLFVCACFDVVPLSAAIELMVAFVRSSGGAVGSQIIAQIHRHSSQIFCCQCK